MKSMYRICDVLSDATWPNKAISWDGHDGFLGIVDATNNIPEFVTHTKMDYVRRLDLNNDSKEYLALLALHCNKPVGLLVSYGKEDGVFYNWMAGVVPKHRGNGVMSAMMDLSEHWATEKGYSCLTVKTYSEFSDMISLLEGRDFAKEYVGNGGAEIDALYFNKSIGPKRASMTNSNFGDTYVCKKLEDRFDIDVRWNVKKVVVDKVKEVSVLGKDTYCEPKLYVETVSERRLSPFWDGYSDHGFREGDKVEIGLDGRGGLAWFDTPNDLCYFRNVSLEERERG